MLWTRGPLATLCLRVGQGVGELGPPGLLERQVSEADGKHDDARAHSELFELHALVRVWSLYP